MLATLFVLLHAHVCLALSMSQQPPRIDSTERVASTKWLALDTYSWTDQDGVARKWDVATRTTTNESGVDAVVIIPILKSEYSLDTLLVEQYRPPVRQATLEFPAGLIDKGETAVQAALRELKEETGYVGQVSGTESRPVCMTPGLATEQVQIVTVHVDLTLPENQNPQAELDDGEHCVVHRVSLKDGLKKVLDNPSKAMPIMGLYLFSIGLDMGLSMSS